MSMNEQKTTIISNDALRGKPYLDIDRVITEGNRHSSTHHKNDQSSREK